MMICPRPCFFNVENVVPLCVKLNVTDFFSVIFAFICRGFVDHFMFFKNCVEEQNFHNGKCDTIIV
jgi:hypothetical protein